MRSLSIQVVPGLSTVTGQMVAQLPCCSALLSWNQYTCSVCWTAQKQGWQFGKLSCWFSVANTWQWRSWTLRIIIQTEIQDNPKITNGKNICQDFILDGPISHWINAVQEFARKTPKSSLCYTSSSQSPGYCNDESSDGQGTWNQISLCSMHFERFDFGGVRMIPISSHFKVPWCSPIKWQMVTVFLDARQQLLANL